MSTDARASAEDLGNQPPSLRGGVPGPESARWVETLARTECPAFTARRARRAERSGAPTDPLTWVEARGSNVWDADGNRYVDLTSGFGAAAVGHRHPRVVAAVQDQSERLLHALGDVHPSDVKVRLLERLADLGPWPQSRVVLGLTGAQAVEVALKTARLRTGRSGVVAFSGGYHGLSYGTLAVCGMSDAFRWPFRDQLNPHVTFAPYPSHDQPADAALRLVDTHWPTPAPGAVLVEPIVGRGGVRVPPAGFLSGLIELAHDRGAVVIMDEVLTGLGRTGSAWRCATEDARPDLLCAGKALGGGLPISACLGSADIMGCWEQTDGDVLHTGTFFGHPLGCAGALATLEVFAEERLAARAQELGAWFHETLRERLRPYACVKEVRGAGLLVGIVFDGGPRTFALLAALMQRGYLALPAGPNAEVLELLPPLTIDRALLEGFVDNLEVALQVSAHDRIEPA